jgi:hypothetical protein
LARRISTRGKTCLRAYTHRQARTGREEVKIISKERADLVDKLVELNVSKVIAEDIIKNND